MRAGSGEDRMRLAVELRRKPLTAEQAAKVMGCTRNAVCALWRRARQAGLDDGPLLSAPRYQGGSEPRPRRERRVTLPAITPPEPVTMAPAPPPAFRPDNAHLRLSAVALDPLIRLTDRAPLTCSWIIGPVAGAATMCCGRPVSGRPSTGHGWCEAHRAIGTARAAA